MKAPGQCQASIRMRRRMLRTLQELAFLPSVANGKGQQNAAAGGGGGGYGIKAGLNDNEKAAAGLLIKAFTDKDYAQRALDNNSFAPINPSLLDNSKLVPLAVNYLKAVERQADYSDI